MRSVLLELPTSHSIIVVRVYDPFYGNTLSDQDFTNKFEDHVNSFFDAMQRTNDKRIKNFLIQRMKMKLKVDLILHLEI